MQVAEERVLHPGEGEGGNRGGDADVDAYIAAAGPVLELPRPLPAGGEQRGSVAVGDTRNDRERLVEIGHRDNPKHRAEDLLPGDDHLRPHVVKDGGADKIAVRVALHLDTPTVQDQFCAFLQPLLNVAQDAV